MHNNLRPASPAHASGRLQRSSDSSHELLTAHPLLNPGPSSSALNLSTSPSSSSSHLAQQELGHSASPQSSNTASMAPKYLPYTPRQARVVTGSATTGTASSPVSASPAHLPQQPGASAATGRLQLQNLKAVAQNHALDTGSLGWALLEELVIGADAAPGWVELWHALSTGKASLLLPTEHAGSEAITPELVRDHIIFCNGSARSDAPFVTLSGLRGTIDERHITFRSTLSTSSKSFKALQNSATRSSALSTLPPLPELSSNHAANFPQIRAPEFVPSLPLPPRSSIPPKPPLPPRPGAKPPAPVARISNPFASFFSKSQAPSSPVSTSLNLPETHPPDHVVEISAFTIESRVNRKNVAKALTKVLKTELKDQLSGLPSWVVERTQNFSQAFLPFPKPSEKPSSESTGSSLPTSDQNSILSVSAHDDPAEDMSQTFQDFYDSLEDELRVEGSPSTLRRKDIRSSDEEREKERLLHEKKLQDIMEKVERALTCVFYDRLFRPSNSDDASHDEALSSRIAALNMLDLTLDHLGVDAGESRSDVDRVVSACGETINGLGVARCPADKAAILVAAHRIIVDGLSRLPPLRLKSEEQLEEERTPQAHSFSSTVHSDVLAGDVSPPKVTVSPDPSTPASEVGEDTALEESKTTETIKGSGESEKINLEEAEIRRPETPLLTVSPPKTPTPVSGDILLPLIIFSVVKMNPPQLVSQLLYTQRFRNHSVGGEESYCLINLMAVVEFLENVDLGALGLKESEKKVMSTADLTPIPLTLPGQDVSAAVTPGGAGGFRGRVEQQVDAITGSANRVLSGVVDSGFGVLRSLLPVAGSTEGNTSAVVDGEDGLAISAPWNVTRPGFGLLRRESGFSIASLAASLPGAAMRDRARSFASAHSAATNLEEEGQEMVESRPGSVKGLVLREESDEDDESGEGSESGGSEGEGEEGEEGEARHDARSIRSFESMMSGRSRSSRRRQAIAQSSLKPDKPKKERLSITDRLASMSRLTKSGNAQHSHSQEPSKQSTQHISPVRTSSLLIGSYGQRDSTRFDTPLSSRAPSPISSLQHPALPVLPTPTRRFLECSADELKMSEIPELLAEYRRLVESLRAVGAFEEPT